MIETLTKRRRLPPRKTPYWQKISVGKYIGFYRSEEGGTWHARMLIDKKRHFHKLDGTIDSEYDDMLKRAQACFEKAVKPAKPEKSKKRNKTIRSVVESYLEHLKFDNSEDAAYRTRKQLEKHLLPVLGDVKLRDLTTDQLKSWRNSLVREDDDPEAVRKSKDSANRVLSMAKAAFNLYFQDGGIKKDREWRRVKPFRKVGKNRELYLKPKQVKDLIKHAPSGLKQLIEGGVHTGARLGELTAVKTSDFDPAQGTLFIREAKTDERIVYLSQDAISFFKKITKNNLPTALIFPQGDGRPWTRSTPTRPFKKAVQNAKLPAETVFYSLRHYHISKALSSGIPAQLVAENCGTSLRMLEKHYAKFMRSDRRAMMDTVQLGL